MINLLVIAIFSALNALRGSGMIDRMTCAAGMGIATLLLPNQSIDHSAIIILIAFIGLWIGFACGWNKYLNIFSGNMQYVNEVCVKPIDWIATKICGIPTNSGQFITWCFVAFTIRGLLFYPVFLALSLYSHHSPLWGLGSALMGCAYYTARIAPVGGQVRVGESIYGAVLGIITVLSIGMN
jgi:hypothetical protein